jgi:hypothetical protein
MKVRANREWTRLYLSKTAATRASQRNRRPQIPASAKPLSIRQSPAPKYPEPPENRLKNRLRTVNRPIFPAKRPETAELVNFCFDNRTRYAKHVHFRFDKGMWYREPVAFSFDKRACYAERVAFRFDKLACYAEPVCFRFDKRTWYAKHVYFRFDKPPWYRVPVAFCFDKRACSAGFRQVCSHRRTNSRAPERVQTDSGYFRAYRLLTT